MTRCARCDQGERRAERRARLAERGGRTALVLDVPVEVCPACGQVWLSMPVAKRLDVMLTDLLNSDAESSQVHWDGKPTQGESAGEGRVDLVAIDVGSEVSRAAAAVAWAAEETRRRVMGTSRRHEEARTWHDGQLNETAAVQAAFETLDAHIDRLATYLPDPGSSHEIDPVYFIGDQGWDFGGWMETKVAPLKSARSLAGQFWETLPHDGEKFYVQDLGKYFETRPELGGALESVAHYASLIAEMLMDKRV